MFAFVKAMADGAGCGAPDSYREASMSRLRRDGRRFEPQLLKMIVLYMV